MTLRGLKPILGTVAATAADTDMPNSSSLAAATGASSWSCRLLAILALTFLSWFAALAVEDANDFGSAPRPQIGLVLGGGGVRGAARIGVLKVLNDKCPQEYLHRSIRLFYLHAGRSSQRFNASLGRVSGDCVSLRLEIDAQS